MLRQIASLAVLVTAAVGGLMTATTASADGATCISYGPHGECTIWSGGGATPGGDPTSPSDPGGGDSSPHLIQIDGHWCAPSGLKNPQPDPSDPIWQGHTDGAIYGCAVAPTVGAGGLVTADWTIWYWAASDPAAPPDPAALAQQAVATMGLRAIRIGIVPSPTAGSVGLVGMPNWMWVAQPDARTFGPVTRSASAGGWTVSATAKVARVSWDMGDGQVIACGAGTAYDPADGKSSSPDCGHTYTRQGSYTVRATSHWVITWSGIGQAGTITMDLTQSTPLTIGEVQVLTQS